MSSVFGIRRLMVLLLLACTGTVWAQEGGEGEAFNQEHMIRHMTPGKEHELLAKMAGEWNAEMNVWMDPSQPPQKSEGSSSNEIVLGGRFLKIDFKMDFMGMPFNGLGYYGYDNTSKKFISNWMDNMSTSIIFSEGHYDEATKTLDLKGRTYDSMMNQEAVFHSVTTIIDENQHKMVMYMDHGQGEVKSFEIMYTKR